MSRARKIEVAVTVNDREYTATVDNGRVTISRDGIWSGTGRWNGDRIEDCAANIGEDVYDALDSELGEAINAKIEHELDALVLSEVRATVRPVTVRRAVSP